MASKKKGTRGFIYFCPELRLYRYKCRTYDGDVLGDETDYKFDSDELEDTLVALLASDDPAKVAEAKFVAHMTGCGRRYPHKIVMFDTGEPNEDQQIKVTEPGMFWAAHDKEKAAREKAEEEAEGQAP